MKQLNNQIVRVLKYFDIFAYHPTLDEIYTFLPVKISKNELKKALIRLKYTPVEYSMLSQNLKVKSKKLKSKVKNNNGAMEQWNNLINKQQISKKKLNSIRFRLYIKLISFFPQIKLIGLSGSISMMNAGEDDDIDLFIITAKNRLFTGRLIALVLAQMLGLRRSRNLKTTNFANKVCLNLFFDESDLKVPGFKQTEFVGHEVLQMKPIIVKGNVYERFLEANRWVFKLFPNATPVIPAKAGIQTKNTWIPFYKGMTRLLKTWSLGFMIFNKVESLLKKFQLRSINKHKTTEIITPTQLWFHPDDFEKKLRRLK